MPSLMESMLSLSICILLITLFVMEQVMFQRTSCLVLILFFVEIFYQLSTFECRSGGAASGVALYEIYLLHQWTLIF